MSFRGLCRAVSRVVIVFGVLAVWETAAWADPPTAIPAGLQRYAPAVNAQQRQELYQQLREQGRVLEAQSMVVKTVAKLVGPTVVHVAADVTPRQSLQMGRSRHVEEAGSGVIIELQSKYYVLTNRHVIRESTKEGIKVSLADGRRLTPDRVWDDADTDVAVLAVAASDLVAAPVGNSDKMEIGDFVLAVGSPFGLSHSVTFGIISAKGRRDLQLGETGSGLRFQDFLQTDAAINPGNSGGPLINLRGEVIGINTAIASSSGGNEGIGFSIPINMFMRIAQQLIETGTVRRAFMGVSLDTKFGPSMAAELGLPRPMGARINGITRNSPAERAQLQVGDVILEFDNKAIEDDSHLINVVSMTEVGKKVPLVVFRNRQPVNVQIEVGDSSKFLQSEQPIFQNR